LSEQVGRIIRPRRRCFGMEIGCDVDNGDGSDVGRQATKRKDAPRGWSCQALRGGPALLRA